MEKWLLYCKKADFNAISAKFNISPMLARILVNRGLNTEEDIQAFLFAGIESMHDPFMFNDMNKACEIILDAIDQGKKIRIVGDYDVDGVTASIILVKFLEYAGGIVDVRLPHRMLEGYGMNESMADEAFADGISLIITCDNGISANEAVSRAKELGLQVIVTDHHEPLSVIPEADAVIDAKCSDSNYPFRELCGAAVAYKLCCALSTLIEGLGFPLNEERSYEGMKNLVDDLLQFAGMGTVADIVPLTGENRIFAKEGIKRLRKSLNPGLQALAQVKGINLDSISEFHIGFVLGPCINSAGRLENARIAFDLLYTDDAEEAMSIACSLSDLNEKRKQMTTDYAIAAENMISENENIKNGLEKIIVVYLPSAHESIAGIIAGKIKESYNLPALVVTDSEDGLKGSGRSGDNYNLVENLQKHPELFRKFGGHAKACGFVLDCTPQELSQVLNSNPIIESIDTDIKVWIDMQLPFKYASCELVNELSVLEPFGLCNDRPLFAERNVKLEDIRILGKNQNVLRMNLQNESGDSIEGIYFARGAMINETYNEIMRVISERGENARFSLTYRPEINDFRGSKYAQAVIVSIKECC